MSKKYISEKKFFSEIASVIIGKKERASIIVPKNKRRALQEVLAVTNMLYQTLERNDSDLNKVIPMIEAKGILAREFEKEFGFPWIL